MLDWFFIQTFLENTTFDLRQCILCRMRKMIIVKTFTVPETGAVHEHQIICDRCYKEAWIRERIVKTDVVPDAVVKQVLRLGPTKVQVDKHQQVTKSAAPKELQWGANTEIEVVFFMKDGTTVGASKRLAIYAYINDAPRVLGVLERARGLDVYTPMSWYKLFNAENEAMMKQLTQEDECEDE